MTRSVFVLLAVFLCRLGSAESVPPRLLVVIVVDQLRADSMQRMIPQLLPPGSARDPGGFRYLAERGAYWPYAEYDLAQCMTGPGHATIATGAYPHRHGITANSWWTGAPPSPERRNVIECVDSANGPGPWNLRVPTLGDALRDRDLRSRVATVALKPRAAVLLGGHSADAVTWFDEQRLAWSGPLRTREVLGSLNPIQLPSSVVVAPPPASVSTRGLPNPLPRRAAPSDVARVGIDAPIGDPNHGEANAAVERPGLYSPIAATMTIDAALALADRLELGVDGVTDLLGISLSAHDIVAHTLGPHSPEVTAMTIAEDREIARLLRGLAKRVPGGLGSIVIALTADHGGPSIPEDVASTGSPAHVIDVVGLAKSLEEHLDARFPALASSESWIAAWTSGNVWLNPKVVRPEMPEWPTVLDTIARHALSQENGYVAASTVTERTAGRWPYGALGRQLGNQVVEGRSGHVILIPAPNVFEEKSGDLVSHVTGYTYDRLVPLMISGPGVRPGVQATRAELVDVAPTLSFLLGILPPAGSTGRVLHEGIDPTRVPW